MTCSTRIEAGKLDQEITIQEATEGDPDAAGETTPTWADVLPTWARVEPEWGKEVERAKQVSPEMTHLLTMRYSPEVSVTPAMRVKLGTRTLAIVSVRDVEEQHVALKLVCKEQI